MDKGLQKGDAVGIVAAASPFYVVVDLALQFLGAVNITFPREVELKTFRQLALENKIRFCFLDNADSFKALDQLRFLKPDMVEVVLKVDDAEGLEPEKLVTFDRVVTLGKVPWREQLATFNGMKEAVSASKDYYAIQSSGATLTFHQLNPICRKCCSIAERSFDHSPHFSA